MNLAIRIHAEGGYVMKRKLPVGVTLLALAANVVFIAYEYIKGREKETK